MEMQQHGPIIDVTPSQEQLNTPAEDGGISDITRSVVDAIADIRASGDDVTTVQVNCANAQYMNEDAIAALIGIHRSGEVRVALIGISEQTRQKIHTYKMSDYLDITDAAEG